MKILVCIKEVLDADPEVELMIDEKSGWVREDESSRYVLNRFDEYALEEALLIKEAISPCSVDVLTVGQERSHLVVRRGLGMGADHGIQIITEQGGYLDPLQISSLVCQVVKNKQYDLILTGVMAEDTQQGQTGVMIASRLGIPWASAVIKETMAADLKSVKVERELEGGMRDVLQLPLPCLLTIQSGINQPRYPALSKVLKAKKAQLEVYHQRDLSEVESLQKIAALSHPKKQRQGTRLAGSSREKAQQLLAILQEKSFIH